MAGPIFVERELIKSEAFRTLPATALVVLMDFLSKRQFARIPNSKGKKEYRISNNGELQYTYKEAEAKGITRPAFVRSLDELMWRGIIALSHHGQGGRKGDVNLFSMEEDWRTWKPGEKIRTRPKDTRQGVGFALVHRRNKTNIGNANVTPSSNAGVTSNTVNQ